MTNTKNIPLTQIHQLVQLLRVYNGRILILFFLLGYTFSDQTLHAELIRPCIALLLSYGLISTSNYLHDQKIDKDNQKSNPYSHLTTQQVNQYYYLIAAILIIFIIISPNPLVLALGIIAILLIGFFYSHPNYRLSHQPIPKFLSMAITYTFIPSVLGTYPQFSTAKLLSLFFLCTLTSSLFLYSDIRDIKGDLKHRKYTIANTLGVKHTCLLAAFLGTFIYIALLATLPQITFLYILIGILPISQWLAVFHNQLVIYRRTLVVINILWLIWLILLITKQSL